VAYAAHPEKVVKDAYTPFGLKLQVALMAMSFGLLPLLHVHSFVPVLLGLVVLAWVAAGLPFARFVAGRDPELAVVAVGFAWLRSYALAAGVIAGILSLALGRHRVRKA
jgi:hypothetical protein